MTYFKRIYIKVVYDLEKCKEMRGKYKKTEKMRGGYKEILL